ncbi:hypothetical protein AQEC111735_12110 [Aquirufa ecclesiirivi]
MATPLTKSPALFKTFPPDNPEITPVKLVVAVMLSVEALKLVTVFPYASCAVMVFVPVKATPLVCGEVNETANLSNVLGLTVTFKVPPVFELIVPSVAFTVADSALYKTIEPVATPAVKVKLVAVPKFVPATVGAVAGLIELAAPEKVMFLAPV